MKQNTKRSHLAWYWLSLTGAVLAIIGGLIGATAGALITIGGHLFLLFSLVAAVAGGIKGKNSVDKVTAGSRVGGFFAALGTAFVVLAIATQL